jgi:uncharacterized protein (TIGR03435 family)
MKLTSLFAVAGIAAGSLLAQSQPSFEVASIRPHEGRVAFVSSTISGPRIRVVAYGLVGLLMEAYDVKYYQLSGFPSWADSDRFDIDAKAEGDGTLTKAQAKQMMQTLLADRFQVRIHRETKELPVYALVVGKNGPKLKESVAEKFSLTMRGTQGVEITVSKGSMEQLATQLSGSGADRPVLDKTGLTGTYDYTLNWVPERDGVPPPGSNGVTLSIAVQEQLGLKLESQKAPIEILVIDHASKPSGN